MFLWFCLGLFSRFGAVHIGDIMETWKCAFENGSIPTSYGRKWIVWFSDWHSYNIAWKSSNRQLIDAYNAWKTPNQLTREAKFTFLLWLSKQSWYVYVCMADWLTMQCDKIQSWRLLSRLWIACFYSWILSRFNLSSSVAIHHLSGHFLSLDSTVLI